MVKKLIALPTWVITNAMSPLLPQGHKWKHRWFTLHEWYVGETETCRTFDIGFWVMGACLLATLLLVRWGPR